MTMKKTRVMFPDYQHSILNVSNSILKYYGAPTHHETLESLDEELQEKKKHVFLILLDGMGMVTLNQHQEETKTFRKYLKTPISSVFPPTTVAATNAVLSAKTPLETGYIGWVQYFPNEEMHNVVFLDEDFYDVNKKAPFILRDQYLKYSTLYEQINQASPNVEIDELFPSFRPNGYLTFAEQLDKAVEISKRESETFTYIYWTDPDLTQHEYGVDSQETKEIMKKLDTTFEDFTKRVHKDSIIIVIADHGLINVEGINLLEYKEIMDTFRLMPSVEPRATAFYVKEEEKENFKQLFYNKFSHDDFLLLNHEEFLDMHYLGKGVAHPMIEEFIGDFMAIATGTKMIVLNHEKNFKAHHAGLTECEMSVPLILFKK